VWNTTTQSPAPVCVGAVVDAMDPDCLGFVVNPMEHPVGPRRALYWPASSRPSVLPTHRGWRAESPNANSLTAARIPDAT
jgi:hypothetical protein